MFYSVLTNRRIESGVFSAALVLAVVTNGGFVFAAPAAVMVYTQFKSNRGFHQVQITAKDNAYISAVGPGINVVIALLFVIISFLFPGGFIALIASIIVRVNVFLALFNLLPIMPFDGSKIYSWNKNAWFLFAGIVFVLWQII